MLFVGRNAPTARPLCSRERYYHCYGRYEGAAALLGCALRRWKDLQIPHYR